MNKLSTALRGDLRLFAFFLVNGTVDDDIIPVGTDYRVIFEWPSTLEQVFAIWANVLECDDAGVPTNAHLAKRRASQYIRTFIDPTYRVEPPFEQWELELHL